MKWVTREKVKVDRVACPWLISRFVDKKPKFIFVPADKVMEVAEREHAMAFDAKGAKLNHFKEGEEERVSFDAIIREYKLDDPALLEMAKIVRGADAKIPDAPRESPGLEAAAAGFREIAKNDHDNLVLQFPFYDAMYAYCRMRVEGRLQPGHSIG
jgi:hypothetical protein